MKRILIPLLLLLACACTEKPYGTLPTQAQLQWQAMETNMFCHFGPNTFTGREWGDGTEAEDLFHPSALDCRQWAATAKAAGFKGIIITAKHHDGFCLWPNPVSRHTVAQSAWKDGQGDVLKELSEACREYGLKFGVYISPWDRNDPHYGTPEYNEVFRSTLESALSGYGPVFEQWFDGACGEGPNGKRQVYDWDLYHSEVFRWQKDAIIFSNVGPGCRWVGNEQGAAGRTNWSTFSPELHGAGEEKLPEDYQTYLNEGDADGARWIPAETDVSIRPGWFWKAAETPRLKTVQQLLRIYYESVGRNSLLLLNVPPDDRGLIDPADSVRLIEWRSALDHIFAEDLSEGAKVRRQGNTWNLRLDGEKTFNRVVLQEDIALGQRIAAFTVEVLQDGEWVETARETTVGYKRIVLLPTVTATAVRVRVDEFLAKPLLTKIALYQDDIYREPAEENEDEGTVNGLSEPLLCDLGEVQALEGFQYTPAPKGRGGVIIDYRLEVSLDGTAWTTVREGMFDNIVNNPVRTEVRLPLKARYLRLQPLRSSGGETYGALSFGRL